MHWELWHVTGGELTESQTSDNLESIKTHKHLCLDKNIHKPVEGKSKDLSLLTAKWCEWNDKFSVTWVFDILSNAKFMVMSIWCLWFIKEVPLVYLLLLS